MHCRCGAAVESSTAGVSACASAFAVDLIDGWPPRTCPQTEAGARTIRARDPEYRRKVYAAARKWRTEHKDEFNARRRRRYATDPKLRKPERTRKYRLKAQYGMSPADYDAMLARQNGRCAICGTRSRRRLVVDHCHEINMVRVLLCDLCNRGLGHFKDDPRLLRKAAAMVEEARARHLGTRRCSRRAAPGGRRICCGCCGRCAPAATLRPLGRGRLRRGRPPVASCPTRARGGVGTVRRAGQQGKRGSTSAPATAAAGPAAGPACLYRARRGLGQ